MQGVADTQKDASLLSPNMTGGMVVSAHQDRLSVAQSSADTYEYAVQLCACTVLSSCDLPWQSNLATTCYLPAMLQMRRYNCTICSDGSGMQRAGRCQTG